MAVETTAQEYASQWRHLLRKHIAGGRQVLREVLAAPMVFEPTDDGYKFSGEAGIGGVVSLPTTVASPTGFEPVFWP